MTVKISPSILGANFCNLERDIKALENNAVSAIHIDVMDGNFVPNIAFSPDQIKMLKTICPDLEFDVHLMVMQPEMLFQRLKDAGARCVTVHAEVCMHLYRTIVSLKSFGFKAGVALNPSTPLEMIQYVTSLVDKVLIMTVEPGFGGQQFIIPMLEKIKALKQMQISQGLIFDIQVDGGIDLTNIKEAIKCGANDIVIGSAIFKNNDIERNIRNFLDAATGKQMEDFLCKGEPSGG